MDKRWSVFALAGVLSLTTQAQDLTKANVTNALNAAAAWVEGSVPGPANTLVWNSTVSTPANATNSMGSSFAAAGLRVVNPVADVRVNGTTLTLTNGAAGITVTNTRSLYLDTPVMTAQAADQTWAVGAGRTLSFGRVASLGGGALAVTGSGTVAFLEKLEDATGRSGPLAVTWSGPTGTVGTAAARKNMILTDRGSGEVTVTVASGSLSAFAGSDNYGFSIGMKKKETWNVSGGTVTADGSTTLNIGGAGDYATNEGEGAVNLSGTGKLVVQGSGSIYLARPKGKSSVAFDAATKGTVNLDGGTLETMRTFEKVTGTNLNVAAFYFNGGTLKATGSNSDWFKRLNVLQVKEGGAGIEVVAGAQALILQPLTHGGVAEADGGLVKSGPGSLGVSNAFTGNITVSAGVLGLENAPASNVVVAAGAGLAFKNPADLAAALTDLSGKYSFDPSAAGGLYCLANVTNQSLSATDFGTRPFVKMGGGTLTLNAAAALGTFTGAVVVAGGTLEYMAAAAIASGTPITVQNGGLLQVKGSAAINSHPLTLSGNYDTGDGNGSLQVWRDGQTSTFEQPITLAGDTKIKAFAAGQTLNFNAPIGGNGNLVIGGGGALASHVQAITFNAASTFAGDVTLKSDSGSNARFMWGVDNAMPSNAALSLGGPSWNNTYAMIDFKGYAQTLKGLADAAALGAIRYVTNSSATATVLTLTDSANRSYSGALGGRIDIVKTGSGTQALTGNGLGHTGTVAVQGGILTVGGNSLQNAEVTVANGKQIQPAASGSYTVGRATLTGSGPDSRGALYFAGNTPVTWNGRITLAGDARVGAYGVTLTRTLTGSIDGPGALSIWAGGGGSTHENTCVFSGQSSFEGPLSLEASFGANLTVKVSGGDDRLPATVPIVLSPSYDFGAWKHAFCRMDLAGTSQRIGSLNSGGGATYCRAVVNSAASTPSTLTLNTVGGTASYEGVIGTNGPCASAGAISVVKQGGGAQLFKMGNIWWTWNDARYGTNGINANVTVNGGAVGFSGPDMLGAANTVTVGPGGALIAPNKATLAALTNDVRFALDAASAVGLYDTWDLTAADPARVFYYSGNAAVSADNTAALPNGLILAGGVISIARDGAPGDAALGPVAAPLHLNGTTLKNNDNNPVLSANRTLTLNAGGAALTAGWGKSLSLLSKITGSGALNINCDSGAVILSNPANDYAGDTTIATQWAGYSGATGKLKLGASEVIPHGAGKGNLILNTGGTLDLNGFSETVNGLSATAANALITNSAATVSVLTVGANGATSRYAGQLGGRIDLVKSGAGTLTLAGPCGAEGATVVAGGTLTLDSTCTLASKTVAVHREATLAVAAGDAFGGASSVTALFVGEEGVTANAQGRLSLPAGAEVTVLHFAINGLFKKAGTWGATGSGATFVDDGIFSGSGVLRVLKTGPARATVLTLK